MEDALIPYKSQRARIEQTFRSIYDAASEAAGKDAADDMEKYNSDELDVKFLDELHIRLIMHHTQLHVERLAALFGFNLDRWIAKHWANNLQFYTDGLFLSKGELYSSIYGDVCKNNPVHNPLDCEG